MIKNKPDGQQHLWTICSPGRRPWGRTFNTLCSHFKTRFQQKFTLKYAEKYFIFWKKLEKSPQRCPLASNSWGLRPQTPELLLPSPVGVSSWKAFTALTSLLSK